MFVNDIYMTIFDKFCRWYSAGSDVIEAHAIAWNLMLLSNHIIRGN